MSGRCIDIVMSFVAAVNAGSIEGLAALMTEDHVFVDSDGKESRGKSRMTSDWREYLGLVPDYRIIVQEAFSSGRTVMLAGEAEGTFIQAGALKPENHWRVPAAWRAVVKGDRIAVWQVYVSPEAMASVPKRTGGT